MTIFLSSPCLCTGASSPHCAATVRRFSRDMTLLQSSSPSTETGTSTTLLSRCAPSWRRGASQSSRAQPSSPVIPSSRQWRRTVRMTTTSMMPVRLRGGLWSPSAGRGALRFQAGRTMTVLSSRAPRSTPVAMTGASGAWPVPASVPQEPSTGPTRA